MRHRTHPTQQDEALRRVRHTRDERTLAGLRHIARQLATTNPNAPMTDAERHKAVRVYVLDHHRGNIVIASRVRWDLLDALGEILPGETRGEYAVRTQLKIQGVQA
ncbi:hypothetical protein [Streptomyces misionensis]|uniref:hypothetical protein n=1 Tax=Streptomyces misionensis TaxID=67331 RepID=UPI003688095C